MLNVFFAIWGLWTIKEWRSLEPRDYDHFLVQVASERAIAETYEHSVWILEELQRLENELQSEKRGLGNVEG
mgnify:CR=1 FL=1